MNYNAKTAIEQIEKNEYENEGGRIDNNLAWRWIKQTLLPPSVDTKRINDPKVIAKLLRAMASGDNAKRDKHDIVLLVAADMIDCPAETSILIEHVERDLKSHRRANPEHVAALIDIIKIAHGGARNIVIEEWHRIVKEFSLMPGTTAEVVTARVLERLTPMTAAEVRMLIAKQIWAYQECQQTYGDFHSLFPGDSMAAFMQKTCIDQAELIRKALYG